MLRLAESLGAETVTLDGPTPADALIEYAQTRNVTRVIVGSPEAVGVARVAASVYSDATPAPRSRIRCDFDCGGGTYATAARARYAHHRRDHPPPVRWERYGWALGNERRLLGDRVRVVSGI